jgi:penicillin amidase
VEADLAAALDLLAGWDGTLGVDSPAAALYEALVREMLKILLAGKLAGLEEHVRGKSPSGLWEFHAWEWLASRLEEPGSAWWDLGEEKGRDVVFLLALRGAVAFLRETLGLDLLSWKWGALHQVTFGHILGRQAPLDKAFNQGPYPVGGDGGTIWATFSSQLTFEHDLITGPPFRFLIDMADPEHAQVIFAPGQSGRPSSPHYGDGIPAWFKGEYHPLLFRREEIEKEVEARFYIEPVSPATPAARPSGPGGGAGSGRA